MSFRGAGAAREPGIYEHGHPDTSARTVFMVSGPGPLGRPGMTVELEVIRWKYRTSARTRTRSSGVT